jgi:large subunit ribosomal protein L2
MFAKAAGCFCQLVQKSKDSCLIKLPSGKFRKVSPFSFATIGLVSNSDFKTISLKKAGRSRWLNKRPKVRGVAMNPVDHPHGGGEGKSSGGRHLVSAWGKRLKK